MDEQEQTLHTLKTSGVTTFRVLFALFRLIRQHKSKVEIKNFTKGGAQETTSFLKYGQNKQSVDLSKYMDEPVNLDTIQKYLEETGVAFSFRDLPAGGQELLFQGHDENIIAQVLEKLEKEMTTHPESFARQGPTMKESVAKATQTQAAERAQANAAEKATNKAAGMAEEMVKDGPSL